MTKLILNLYTNLHKTRSKTFIHKALQETLENNSQKVLSTDASCISSFKSLLSKSIVPITSSEKTTVNSLKSLFLQTDSIELSLDDIFHEQILKLAKKKGLKIKESNPKKNPRFLYHLTTKENYANILQTGEINPSSDKLCGQNIFMFDMINFFKHWTKQFEGGALAKSIDKMLLCKMVGKKDTSIVLLRIPTKSMNIEKLRIRSQDALFTAGDYVLQTQKYLLNKYNCASMAELLEIIKNDEKAFYEVFDWYKKARHLSLGAPAGMNKLLAERKHALEYIYPENISTRDISMVGEIDSSKIDFETTSIKDIFGEMLQNQPEYNCLKLLG